MSFQEIEDVVETMFDEIGVAYDFDWRDFTLPYGPKTTLTIPQTKALVKTVIKYVNSGRNMGGYIINAWTVLEAINHFQFRKLQAPHTITLTLIKDAEDPNPVTVEATQEMAMGLYWGLRSLENDLKEEGIVTTDDSSYTKPISTSGVTIRFPDGRPLILHPPIAYQGVCHRLELNGKIYCYRTDEFLTGIQLAHRVSNKTPPNHEI